MKKAWRDSLERFSFFNTWCMITVHDIVNGQNPENHHPDDEKIPIIYLFGNSTIPGGWPGIFFINSSVLKLTPLCFEISRNWVFQGWWIFVGVPPWGWSSGLPPLRSADSNSWAVRRPQVRCGRWRNLILKTYSRSWQYTKEMVVLKCSTCYALCLKMHVWLTYSKVSLGLDFRQTIATQAKLVGEKLVQQQGNALEHVFVLVYPDMIRSYFGSFSYYDFILYAVIV